MSSEPSDLPVSLARADMEAFQRAYQAYLNPLRRYVYTYVASWETAEELVNDAFLQLWRRLRDGEPVRDLKAYLYITVRNHAMSHLRRRQVEARHLREHVRPQLGGSDQTQFPEAERDVLLREAAAALLRAVDTLPPRQREVILLKWQRQATHEEIAEALGIAPKTVAEHFSRALDHLRTALPKRLSDLL